MSCYDKSPVKTVSELDKTLSDQKPASGLDKTPPDQKPESGFNKKPSDKASKTIPVLIQRTTSSTECPNEMNQNLYNNKNVKNQSWASNYLQSIGLTYDTTIYKRKNKLNSSEDKSSNFLIQNSMVTRYANVNLANDITNVNYNNVCNVSSYENDVSFTNYNNIPATTEIHGNLSTASYINTYINNHNNSYYFNQPKENVASDQFPVMYYDSVTPNTMANTNLPTTYLNTFDQSRRINVTNNTYYNSNESSQMVGVDLPVTYLDTYSNQNNYCGQNSILNENHTITPINLYDNETSITIDSNLPTSNSGPHDSDIHTNPSNAFNRINVVNSQQNNVLNESQNAQTITSANLYDNEAPVTIDSNLQTLNSDPDNSAVHTNPSTVLNQENVENSQNIEKSALNIIEREKCCNCLCSKSNQDKKQIKENEHKQTKKLEQICLSKVQENEKKFRDFLQKLNMKRHSEQENNEIYKEDKAEKKRRKRTDSQQAKETSPKLFKKKYVDEQNTTRNKRKEIQPAKKTHTKVIETNYVDERVYSKNEKSKVIEFPHDEKMRHPHDEKMRQIFKHAKYLDKQQHEMIRKRNEVVRQDEITRPKFIKTKYVDEQEPFYRSPKKPRIDNDYEIIHYTNPEYKTMKKLNIDNKCEKPKSETTTSKINKREDNSHNFKTLKTESKKYFKYKDCDETSKTSPEKGILKKNNDSKKYLRPDISENKDLRNILSRKLHKKENITKNNGHEYEEPKNKSDVLNDNLVITVNNNIGDMEKLPEKNSNKNKPKRDSCKKINLVINILYKEPSSQSESDKSEDDNHSPLANSDLSFLDEINVDEIVESLSKSEKIGIHKNTLNDESNTKPEERVYVNETDINNDLIKKENVDINKAHVITNNGDLLNDLLLKEASLLDSLRLVHQEIEKRSLGNFHKEEKQLLDHATPVSSILPETEDQTLSLMPINTLLESIKKRGTKYKIDMSCDEYPSNREMNLYNLKPINETNILGGDLNITTIDLSSDDSNDYKKMDEIKLKTTIQEEKSLNSIQTKDCFYNFNRMQQINTIDLTSDEIVDEVNEIQVITLFENEFNNTVDDTINNVHTIESNKVLQKNGDTMKENNTIPGNDDFNNRKKLVDTMTKINNNTVKKVADTLIIKEKPQNIKTNNDLKELPNKQITKPQSSISAEPKTGISKTSADDCNITQENYISVTEFVNIVNSDRGIENNDSESQLEINDHICTFDITTGISKALVEDTTHNKENRMSAICKEEVIRGTNSSAINFNIEHNNNNASKASENENVAQFNQKCTEIDKYISEDKNTVNVCDTLIGENGIKEKNAKGSDTVIEILNEQDGSSNDVTRTEQKDENNSSIKTKETLKTQNEVKNKSDSLDTKIIPSSSLDSNNPTEQKSKKDEINDKFVNKVKFGGYNKKLNSTIIDRDAAIAVRLERQMLKCFNENILVDSLIHSGSFSKIFRCRNEKTGRYYAVKSLNSASVYKNAQQVDMLFGLQSGKASSCFSCVYILNSFSFGGHLCLFMDYYPKNLKRALEENAKPFHINVVQHLARQLVSAVALLSEHDILHSDINPKHILLDHTNSQLKLCGFDRARKVPNIKPNPNIVTSNYRPPESIIGYKLGIKVDVWATGLVLYEMATNIQLFPGTTDNDILFKQMCTLGALPVEMIQRSRFSHKHFTGSSFKRIMEPSHNINLKTKFYKSRRLESTISRAYNTYWRPSATKQGLSADAEKCMSLTSLLREMLQMDPRQRMPIQFVNLHPFISRF
ncbi:uncharacterized protein MAL13P1.304-like isoform X2 [Plodia interpunctella]|uniref:uncharacterized protein MAL13P1.304-like isoform X2 n=1 Tax=Plodia interpunctella TaxID=58824 RepID=UPI0023682F0A|nr:uncharacterized protein MAL13P1.304-like isoform X2 [Plodia interpunctella]